MTRTAATTRTVAFAFNPFAYEQSEALIIGAQTWTARRAAAGTGHITAEALNEAIDAFEAMSADEQFAAAATCAGLLG